jgi:hypothetical protein
MYYLDFSKKPDVFSEVICSLFKVLGRFGIVIFGHWNLFVIWSLDFGI